MVVDRGARDLRRRCSWPRAAVTTTTAPTPARARTRPRPQPAPEFPAGSTMASIQDEGKIVVGTKFDQPLFGLKNPTNDEVEGFDVEIAKLIAEGIFGDENVDGKVEFVETLSKNRETFIEDGTRRHGRRDLHDQRRAQAAGRLRRARTTSAGQDIMVKADDTDDHGRRGPERQEGLLRAGLDVDRQRAASRRRRPISGSRSTPTRCAPRRWPTAGSTRSPPTTSSCSG